jgi:hypothetical protein
VHVQTEPIAQLFLSRNAHFGKTSPLRFEDPTFAITAIGTREDSVFNTFLIRRYWRQVHRGRAFLGKPAVRLFAELTVFWHRAALLLQAGIFGGFLMAMAAFLGEVQILRGRKSAPSLDDSEGLRRAPQFD